MTFLFASVTLIITHVILIFIFHFLENFSLSDLMVYWTVFLMALVFHESLSLGLRLTYISKRRFVRLSLVSISILLIIFILIFVSWRSLVFWALKWIFLFLEGGCRLAFISALMVFSIISSYNFKLRSYYVCIDRHSFLRK